MNKSTITIDVTLDKDRVPHSIEWKASDTGKEDIQKARAMMLAFWDGAEKTALRIDLWTKEMMVDEMVDFFYQTIMTMADTYGRATSDSKQVETMKKFAKEFHHEFQHKQIQKHKK